MQYAHKIFNILRYFYKEAFQTGIFKMNKSITLCGKSGRQKENKKEAEKIYFKFFFYEENSPQIANNQIVKEYRLKKDTQI